MGSKNSTPAPDPKLVEAQIRSLDKQNDAIDAMQALSQEMAPLQRAQLEQSMAQMAQHMAQADVLQQWNEADREYLLGKRSQLDGMHMRCCRMRTTTARKTDAGSLRRSQIRTWRRRFTPRATRTRARRRAWVSIPTTGAWQRKARSLRQVKRWRGCRGASLRATRRAPRAGNWWTGPPTRLPVSPP